VRLLWPIKNCAGSKTKFYSVPHAYLAQDVPDYDPNARGGSFWPTVDRNWLQIDEIELTTPVVFDASAGFWSDDIVRSITATPAGTVVQIDPMSVMPEPMAEQSAVVEDIAGIDDVMGEWAGLNMDEASTQVFPVSLPTVKTPVVSAENSKSESENRALDLLMAGMALGAVVSKARKSKDQQ
jgi:hypothetical protein